MLLRGHWATPWSLPHWERLPERFEIAVAETGSNAFDLGGVRLERIRVRALRDVFPRGQLGDHLAGVLGDRYLSPMDAFAR